MSKQSARRDVPNKIILSEREVPKAWYNVMADMPNKIAPPLNPGTQKPLQPDDLAAIFPRALIEQEMSTERFIDIPDDVRRIYQTYRTTPLHRAYRLEEALGTPARIYYKYEGGNTSGSHKLNSALAQAWYNKQAGIKRLSTETGAGQWGTALSMACSMFGMDCTVYMVRVSYEQKPYRRSVIQTYGANIISSPSTTTEAGRKALALDPDTVGTLGIAISEAVEDAALHGDTNYALGSVLNHVILHQSIIGLEVKKQLESIDEKADIIIGCCGGGSNLGGLVGPFLKDRLANDKMRLIAVEPSSCPTLTRGKFCYDFGDNAKLTPLLPQYSLGHAFVPAGIHAGGLRYHGAASIISQLVKDGLVEATSADQTKVFEAAIQFTRAEGLLPAPESSHAIYGAIQEALKCRETGEEKVIVFGLSGNGYFDLTAYDNYLSGKMVDATFTDAMLKEGLSCIPPVSL